MLIRDLGQLAYRDAWQIQEQAHQQLLEGGQEQILLVEHAPVITLGRRSGAMRHLLASEQQLASLGVELVQSDRGGDITYHGPGQVVVYPILRLADCGLSPGGYVHRLEDVVIATLAPFGITGQKDPSAVGVWVQQQGSARKVCAFGVRVKRGISLHGLALNVRTHLRHFELIVPCGLAQRGVTSMEALLGPACPSMAQVKQVLTERLVYKLEQLRQRTAAAERQNPAAG